MFKHILVPIDFSSRSEQALEIALSIAALDQGQVHLLHVIELIPNATFEEFKDFYAKLDQQAHAQMRRLLEAHRDAPDLQYTIAYGQRAPEILKFAEDNQVDLIVLNSHKIDLAEPTQGWGTISHKVGLLAACPVLLVK
jgi:nucleotide-binding universal stress UspA family protein